MRRKSANPFASVAGGAAQYGICRQPGQTGEAPLFSAREGARVREKY